MIYQSSYVAGWHADGPVYLMSAITLMTLAASAVERTRPHRRHQAGGRLRPSRRIRWAPHFALAAGLALLFAAALDAHPATMVGLVCGAVAMVAGVMARQLLALRENEFLLTRDSLTGLANRVELAKSLRAALAQSARKGSRVGVLLIDLNGFKQVNDTYGHAAGDQLLVSFGEVLRAHVRAGDTPARLGGDEFAVIMAGLEGAAEAMGVADRVVAAAAATRPLEGLPVGIRASIGVCLSAPSTNGRPAAIDAAAEDVLRRADAAMYRAKRAGGEGWLLASGTGLVHTADPARDPVVVAG